LPCARVSALADSIQPYTQLDAVEPVRSLDVELEQRLAGLGAAGGRHRPEW
jgi:hypothetical protein